MASASGIALHDTHAALGAVFGERAGQAVVASYGAAGEEYVAARDRAGLVDLHERGLLEVTGKSRLKFLQGMLSNDVASLQPGQGCRAAFLSSKGAVLALLRVLVEADAVWIEAVAEGLPALQRSLEHYRVAAPVRFAARPQAVLSVIGPRAADVLSAVGVASPPAAPEAHVAATIGGQAVRVARAGDLPRGGFVVHVAADAAAVWQALRLAGAEPVGRDALDALRVESLRPWYGTDVDQGNLLHETGLLRECHSPSKGCYVGQEVVARLEGRGGHVNKALRGLRLGAPAEAGAPVMAGEREAGRITTAAVSPRLGPIALGYLHRDHFAPGTQLSVQGTPATVVERFEEQP